jgi:hypothetical protein
MSQKFQIELDDQDFKKLKKLCMGNEKVMLEYIKKALKDKIKQEELPNSPKDSLESYLSKGQSGSRNYGVKGQGW